jgi:hypothetical protein
MNDSVVMQRVGVSAMRIPAYTWLLAFAISAGCGGASPTSTDSVAFTGGTYTLQSIGGARLPVVAVQTGSSTVLIEAGQLEMTGAGSWFEKSTIETVSGPQTVLQVGGDTGTWTQSGPYLSLYSTRNNKTKYSGTFAGNALDLVYGSTLFIFVK